jgi:hypothetical protein
LKQGVLHDTSRAATKGHWNLSFHVPFFCSRRQTVYSMTSKDRRVPIFQIFILVIQVYGALILLAPRPAAGDVTFRVASYNVENLFDMTHDGTEYPDFIPDSKYMWNRAMLSIKAENLSRVLVALDAHVIALQEVESITALAYLRDVLRNKGLDYPWAAITEEADTAVKCAILSRYPIVDSSDVVVPGRGNRNILKVTIEIDETPLVLYVNHWRSRNAPESQRTLAAGILWEAVSALPDGTDYILLGDFNSSHNEFEIIQNENRINDTGGKTGINHVLRTKKDGRLVDPLVLVQHPGKGLHYNLWNELTEDRRWSYIYAGQKRTLDSIILPASLYDGKGISYLDNSFDTFDPGFLFKDGRIFRWQREKEGRGRHVGEGYSDHLPIYACFTTAGFVPSNRSAPCQPEPVLAAVSDLYESKSGAVRYLIKRAAVIYRHDNNAVIKQKGDRAIYVYGAAEGLDVGETYDLVVNRLGRYYGRIQVQGIESRASRSAENISDLLLTDPLADLADPLFENEVVSQRIGNYGDGWFYYAPGKRVRLFFRDRSFVPEGCGHVMIDNARMGFRKEPVLVIEKPSQITCSNERPDYLPGT